MHGLSASGAANSTCSTPSVYVASSASPHTQVELPTVTSPMIRPSSSQAAPRSGSGSIVSSDAGDADGDPPDGVAQPARPSPTMAKAAATTEMVRMDRLMVFPSSDAEHRTDARSHIMMPGSEGSVEGP